MAIDLDKVRKFVAYEKSRFDTDRKAIKEARQQASGSAWRDSFGKIESTLKHKVRVDAINQIINKICSKFTSNPFRFLSSGKDTRELPLDYGSYDTAVAAAFRDSIVAGQGFIYVDYASGRARRLDAGSVMMDSSIDSPYVITVEKKSQRQ
ncbi:MAG: hypothetical protein LBH25_09615 [Fibromonadaceae bacterium]|jgi:hypothetical protein|nr:hypothetical protein [Fibromonadaceae bacterium]